MSVVERTVLGALLAATLATMLLVARNDLAPVQRPLSFGLVLWAWVVLFYSAVGFAALLLGGLASRLPALRGLPRWLVSTAILVFTLVALGSNPRAVSSLFSMDGPSSFRLFVPASAGLCALVLAALAVPLSRGRAAVRIGAVMAVAGGLLALFPERERSSDGRRATLSARVQGMRVAVVGVDGADWDLMEPLMARGDLPHFRAIKEGGAWGSLETLQPTLSPAIWTSVVTGKLPRRHGVRDFTTRRLRGIEESLPDLRPLNRLGFPFLFARLEAADQMFQAPITSFTRRVPAFWNIATARGSPVNVINWWGTWPAEPVLGEIVSERAYYHELVHRGKPERLHGLTYPDELYPQIAPLIALPDDVTLAEAREFMDVSAAEFERMRVKHPSPLVGIANEFTYFHSMFTTNERLALDAMERSRRRYGQPADLLVLFRLVDKTCHTALVYSELVAEHPGASSDDLRRYGRVVSAAYRAVDGALGRIQEAFGPGNVILVSDHGFKLEGAKGYNHTRAPPGVFLAAGPAFRPGRVEGLSVLDVLPLLLYLKGFPLAEDFDGRLPAEVLQPGLLASSPPRRIASYGRRGREGQALAGSSEVDAEMLERLRALGYLQ
jgi:hypothetical protein